MPYGNEEFRAWQQLANAGLVEGKYNGVQGPNSYIQPLPGINAPKSKISNMAWNIYYLGNFVGDGWTIQYDLGNFLSVQDATNGKGFLTEEAWSVDTKLDDGKPRERFYSWLEPDGMHYVNIHHRLCSDLSTRPHR